MVRPTVTTGPGDEVQIEPQSDDGFSLIEVIVALGILAVAIVAFVVGLAATVKDSDVHRKSATIQGILRDEAEALQLSAATCASGGTMSPSYTQPTNYTLTLNPASPACPTTGSPTKITITSASSDGRAQDNVTIWVTKP